MVQTETRALMAPMLKSWLQQFALILSPPVPSEDPDDWSLRTEVSFDKLRRRRTVGFKILMFLLCSIFLYRMDNRTGIFKTEMIVIHLTLILLYRFSSHSNKLLPTLQILPQPSSQVSPSMGSRFSLIKQATKFEVELLTIHLISGAWSSVADLCIRIQSI